MLTPEDLNAIEKRMRQIIASDHPFVSRSVSVHEVRELFQERPYILSIL